MTIKKLRASTKMTQKEFAEYFNIPQKTLEKWEQEVRTPPKYLVELVEYKINKEEINMMKPNENGKYDVLNQSRCEWMEVSEEWLNNVDLTEAEELRYVNGTKQTLEVIPYMGSSKHYEKIHGSWARNY